MSDDEEKVCLTAGQIENIGKAYAKEIEGKDIKGTCPKATRWVRGFFGKKKKKKEPKEPIEAVIDRTIVKRLNRWLDELF